MDSFANGVPEGLVISVIDVTVVITGQDANNAAKVLNRVRERFSDVAPFWSDVKFPDARGRKCQKATPVACVREAHKHFIYI